ncbi:MAG: PIN domain-containing protein [Sporomusaceae bacterium]|jgi:predicted nucleic acid-binding protein|nr:PIN domain-containing protein [Sporomusaceae bacterium]
MTGILLDTNLVIDWLIGYRKSRPKNEEQRFRAEAAAKLLSQTFQTKQLTYISCHTFKELLQYPRISPEEEKRIYSILLATTIILPTTREIAQIAGLMARQSHEYRNHHIEDCYIASTAIFHKIPLYTRNPADYSYVQHENLIIKIPY